MCVCVCRFREQKGGGASSGTTERPTGNRVVMDLTDGIVLPGAAHRRRGAPPRHPAGGGPERSAWLLNSGYYRLLPQTCMLALRQAVLVAQLMLSAPLPFYRAYLTVV